jgi:hypothetical protein
VVVVLHRLIGQIVYRYDDDSLAEPFKIVTYDSNQQVFTVRSVSHPSESEEIDENNECDWYTAPPADALNRWDRFQSKRIGEGIWMSTAHPSMQDNLNVLVDLFAATETPDYHPGTNGIVRDLVHPSLYPLIIDPNTINVASRSRWYRQHERSRFQWLPTEVANDAHGSATFTSEINNLDSTKYSALKLELEKIFSALVPGFEKVRLASFGLLCLTQLGARCGDMRNVLKLTQRANVCTFRSLTTKLLPP